MTDEERRGRGRPVTQPCGTPAGRRRHLRRGEPVCDECAAAYSAEQRRMYEQRRAKTRP